jgi:hypothetical protein
MAGKQRAWTPQREAFWRAHHEAWKQGFLNQREYCEAHSIPLTAFENWRAKFKAEPQAPASKLLWRRGLSHTLNHIVGHSPGHMTNDPLSRPIVPRPCEGHRRTFSKGDKRQIVEEAMQPGVSLSEVARRYGIAPRLLFHWKQELTAAAPVFVSVEITDATSQTEGCAS